MRPVVSIIVPCYNGAQYLEEAVESALVQTFTGLECIIVDDGSTDNSRQVSESLMRRDPRVRYCYKDNGGVSSALNFGVRHAQGKWIQFLAADDWLHEDKLRFQLSYLDGLGSDGDVVFYSDYQVVYHDGDQNAVRRVTNVVGDLTNEQLLERAITWDFKPNFPFIAHSVLIRRSIFDKRMFNEDLRAFEDIEFEIDLLLRGIPFVYTPIVGAFYRQHSPHQLTNAPDRKDYYVRFLELLHEKDEGLLLRNPNVIGLLTKAFMEKDRGRFNRLIRLVDMPRMPVCFSNGRIRVKSKLLLKLAFWWSFLVPMSIPRAVLGLYRRFQTVS
jgi:glycosyltransferase involved in cell wall biosynthesis